MKRKGSASRRRLEFEVVHDQLTRRREAFTARLERWVRPAGECRIWIGKPAASNDYRVISFKYKGKHVVIAVQRLFLIMKLGRPIRLGYEAGHTCGDHTCVVHLEEQHYKDNLLERDQRARNRDDQEQIPF